MILGFSQVIDGRLTNFIEKIWTGLIETGQATKFEYTQYSGAYYRKFRKHWDSHEIYQKAKRHTIRSLRKTEYDEIAKTQWRVGHKINFAIHNRTPLYFQFAPVVQVKSKQRVFMTYSETEGFQVSIDSNELYKFEIEILAANDGFDNIEDFEAYFIDAMDEDQQFEGVLIHWTDLKYLGNGQGTK